MKRFPWPCNSTPIAYLWCFAFSLWLFNIHIKCTQIWWFNVIWGTQAFPVMHIQIFKPCFWLIIIMVAINTSIWIAGFKALSPPNGHFDLLTLVLNSCYRHSEHSSSLCGLHFFIYKMRKLYILSLGSLQVLHSITWNYLFTGLGIISTVVRMFTSPLPPPHVSQIFPFTYLTSPFIGRKKKYRFGTWGTRAVWLSFFWQMCVELNTFVPGCRDVSKTDTAPDLRDFTV